MREKTKIILATSNKNKVIELKELFARFTNIELVSVKDILGYVPNVIEDQDTLEGNAIKKALTTSLLLDSWVMSDDSGLEVKALNGAPGVISARYAGENVSAQDNIDKLLKVMESISEREARMACVLCFIHIKEKKVFKGIVKGMINRKQIIKTDFFGYDPIFIPQGFDLSFSQLSKKEKNLISHRGRAIQQAEEFLNSL